MKLVYNQGNFKGYITKILGYPCFISGSDRSGYLVTVPFGKTKKEKIMFDNLVYYNKSSYYGKTKEKARENVKDFIKNYKR